MTLRKAGIALAITCVSALTTPVVASAATHSTAAKTAAATTQASSFKRIPVTGRAHNGKRFTGHYTVTQFVTKKGKTFAVGTLTGRLGNRTIKPKQVSMPASVVKPAAGLAQTAATCSVLHLTLGPLNLNLLGLQVTLNQVNLNINAISGPGNLLGNLLCSVAGLLDNNPLGGLLSGGQLTGLLNIVQQLVGNPGLLGL